MPVPTTDRLPPPDEPVSLPLPGGIVLTDLDPARVLQPALTPLSPFFQVLEAVLAIFDTVRAIPESLGPPPDPTALIEAIAEAARKVSQLLGLVPQLSLPRTVLGLIDVVLAVLEDAVSQLRALADRLAVLERAEERATALGDEQLSRILGVASANVMTEVQNVGAKLGGLSGLFGLLSLLSQLMGGPEIPNLERPPTGEIDSFVSMLEDLVQTLRGVRRLIPL